MEKYKGSFRALMWCVALAMTAVGAGCGGGDDNNSGGGRGTGRDGLGAGPTPPNLMSLTTNNFVILTKTGITNTGSHGTAITGNIGASPITAAAMNTVFCAEITGTIYGVDAAYVGSGATTCFAGNPPLANKTLVDNAVLDMGTAYNDASARAPHVTELGAGNIGGLTISPGTYKWSTGVLIPTNVTLSGGANDTWIFQISGDITMASAARIQLTGGALPSNVFWQVAGGTGVALGTTSHLEGTVLAAKAITVATGATVKGRLLSQTTVTLDANTVGP